MTADEFLQQCSATLTQRGKQYDSVTLRERSAARAADIYNDTFRLNTSSDLDATDVWAVLISVKLARLRTVADPTDTIIDIINYFALLGEELTTNAV